MSAAEQQRRQCCSCGKRIYQSKRDARRAMRKVGNRIRVYRCHQGPWFHVTSKAIDK